MNTRYLLIICTLALLTVLSSCKKEHESTVFFWDETGCADPWRQDSNDSEEDRKSVIENYLEGQNIKVEKIEIEFDETKEQFCRACQCTTGRVIVVQVVFSNKQKMEDLNFYQ